MKSIKKIIKNFISHIIWIMISLGFDWLYENTRKKYKIDPTFRFNGKFIYLYGEGEIIIGKNTYIGEYSTIEAGEGLYVKIGSNCQISHNVRMYTSSLNAEEYIKGKKVPKNANIIIGNNTWIGANVFINPGVEIGDYVVIGANSVVTKNIPSYSIAVGSPARIIKKLNSNGEIECLKQEIY